MCSSDLFRAGPETDRSAFVRLARFHEAGQGVGGGCRHPARGRSSTCRGGEEPLRRAAGRCVDRLYKGGVGRERAIMTRLLGAGEQIFHIWPLCNHIRMGEQVEYDPAVFSSVSALYTCA